MNSSSLLTTLLTLNDNNSYDNDVVLEPAIMQWHEAENATEAGKAFQTRVLDFINWLKNAEEESDDE